MSRLIDADALLGHIDEERKYLLNRGLADAEHILVHNFMKLVTDAPTVEERPKGKWVNFNSYFRKCSLCQKVVGFDYIEQNGETFNFCPNCGASMRGDKHETD